LPLLLNFVVIHAGSPTGFSTVILRRLLLPCALHCTSCFAYRTFLRAIAHCDADFLLCRFVAFVDFCPVHQVPEGIDVIRTLVLILQVVGVFPHIQAKDWGFAVH